MDPVYRNMHSYPYQRDQIHYAPHFYPAPEPIPTQMYVGPSGRPPVNYGCCPWGSNHGYTSPIACHGCCNHPYFTNHYTYGYPYPHHVPPSHCPVSYPYFPLQYVPPPPPMEHPRYEYEKNMPMGGQHCCECPNHKPHQKEQKSLRIEEEELPTDYSNKKEPRDDDNNNNSGVWRDRTRNGWYPLDLNNMVYSKKQDDDDDDDGKGCFSLPLIWAPYKPDKKEMEMEKCNSKDSNTKRGLELEKGSSGEKKIHVIGEDIGGKGASRVKNIKVKEVQEHEEKENFKNQEKENDAFVKDSIDNGPSEFSKESVERKSPSPSKSSKLPPVCLRVDPLPRRKTANGNSRSGEAKSKVFNSSKNKKLDKILTDEFKEIKGTKTIEVVDGNTLQDKNTDLNVEIRVNQPEEKPKEGNKDGKANEAKVTSKGKASDEEAAVIIQSAYRGFDTRRWEPLKKLKQIAKVQEQMDNVKHMIRAMESSSDIEDSSKRRNIVSETIMSLLLELDTIQGLHQSIREVRKSVVKELVSLQEKLDSVVNEKPRDQPEPEPEPERESISSDKIEDVILSKNGNEIEVKNTAENESEKNDGTDYVENVGALEDENGDEETAGDRGEEDDVLAEKNKELSEENERLRGIMENMIKSGQEQLTAITSLTGRVKELERKLSKKKKLSKVRTRKSNKMRTVVPYDE